MTIHTIVNAINAHPEIWVTIWNARHDRRLYQGHYDRLTTPMLFWEVESFIVEEMCSNGCSRFVSRMTIHLEAGAELR